MNLNYSQLELNILFRSVVSYSLPPLKVTAPFMSRDPNPEVSLESKQDEADNDWRSRRQRKQLFELEKHPVEASPLTQLFLVLTNKTYDCADPHSTSTTNRGDGSCTSVEEAVRMGRQLRAQHQQNGTSLETSILSTPLKTTASSKSVLKLREKLSVSQELMSDTAVHYAKSSLLVIPDTVVWENNIPKGWFYFDRRENMVHRRKVETTAVQEALLAGAKYENDVVATLYTLGAPQGGNPSATRRALDTTIEKELALMQRAKKEDEEDRDANTVHCRFLTAAELPSFLFDVEGGSKGSSMLQKFTHSIDLSRVDILQAIWTPGGAIVTRYQNINDLFDERIPLFQRCATIEGRSHHSRCAKLTSRVVAQVKERCMAIADAFRTSCHNKRLISRMVCHFRMTGTIPIVGDPSQELMFLFCSSCRVLPVDAWNRGVLHAKYRIALPLEMPIVIDEEVELEGRATEFATGSSASSQRNSLRRGDGHKGSSMIACFMPSSHIVEQPSTALALASGASHSADAELAAGKRMSWEALQTLYLDYGSIFEEDASSPIRTATLQRVMSHAVATGDVMGYFKNRKRAPLRRGVHDDAPKRVTLRKTTDVLNEALRSAPQADCRAAFLASIPPRALTNAERGELLGLRLKEYLAITSRSVSRGDAPVLEPLRSPQHHRSELEGVIACTLGACRARMAKVLYDHQMFIEEQISQAASGEGSGEDFTCYFDPTYVFEHTVPISNEVCSIPVDALMAQFLKDRVDCVNGGDYLVGYAGRVSAGDLSEPEHGSIVPIELHSTSQPHTSYALKTQLLLSSNPSSYPLVKTLLNYTGDGSYTPPCGMELKVHNVCNDSLDTRSPKRLLPSCLSVRRMGSYLPLIVESFLADLEYQLQMVGGTTK
jgi:hypothetical protein